MNPQHTNTFFRDVCVGGVKFNPNRSKGESKKVPKQGYTHSKKGERIEFLLLSHS